MSIELNVLIMNAPLKNYIHNTVIILDLFFLNIILLSVHYIFNENVNWIISSVYMEYWVLLNGSWIGLTFILKTYLTPMNDIEEYKDKEVEGILIPFKKNGSSNSKRCFNSRNLILFGLSP